MNKKSIFLLLFPALAFAQSQDQNHVKTTVYKKASTEETIDHDNPAHVTVRVSYFDGLGRPVQQVSHKQSATGKDIISHIEYDAFGRQDKDFLPYIRSTASKDYDPGAETNVMNFYGSNNPSLTGNPHFETTQNPYNKKLLEASPLSRVFKQAAPGDVWALGQGKEIKFDYQTNGEEEVILFRVTAAWSSSLEIYADIPLIKDGYYATGQLYKTITKDENWTSGKNHTTEEFKDKEGRVVLKRTYSDYDENNQNEITHDTYYVYDNYGNLTYVIPPLVDTSGSINQNILDGLCYQYKYDRRNRLAEKKLPGKTWEYIVYDKLDRVIATGPARPPFSNLSNPGWMITKYDDFSRPVLTGWISVSSTFNSNLRKTLQQARDGETVYLSESRTATTPDVTIMGVTYRYTNTAWPVSSYHVLSVTYYDDYSYPDAPAIPAEVEGQEVYYNNSRKPKGLVTGTWTRVLRTSTSYRNEKSYMLYDKKSRPIQVFYRNGELGAGGVTQIDTEYDFEGKVLKAVTYHRRIDSDNNLVVKDFYTYSAQGRLLTHTHQTGSNPIQLISENIYDELGQLIVKKTGNTTSDPLQKTDYRYNVRGWLTHINDIDDLEQAGDPKDLFAFKLNYNITENFFNYEGNPLYNGNIAESFWRTASDNVLRKYGYYYDNINRLKEAVYQKPGSVSETSRAYNEYIKYDLNGNILFLIRNGEADDVSPIEIDDLVYEYEQNSNRLIKVTDGTTPGHNSGFTDGADNAEEYGYDNWGNMTRDDNKGITNIKYNHLNLPTEIIFAGGNKIQYIYDALGQKREKIVTVGSTETTTKYMDGGFQYISNVLQFFPHAEGYVTKEGSSTYRYVFQHKDHLGNIRLKYCDLNQNGIIDANEILEENNYYPFGLRHEGYNTNVHGLANQYKYNGKEFQNELGLNVTAMDFRQYDSAIGRFNGMDALSELYPDFSPFRFGFNNPNYWSDPTGLLENNLAYPEGNGTTPGQVHIDDDGHWIWNGSLWVGQNGTPDMLAEVVVSASNSSSSNDNNYLISQWWNARNLAFDANVRMKYYFPRNSYILNNSSNAAEYAFSRYHLQQSTRAQLSPQGKAISEILKSKKAQLETAKYYAHNKINPSGNLRGGLSSAKLLRGAGTSVVVISAGMSIYNVATAENTTQALSTEIGGWTGAYAGAKAGAAFGSLFGPWGTVIGGVVGGAIGYWGGTEAGSAIYNSTQD